MTHIIDMRSRPALLHDFYGATPGTAQYETVRWLNRRMGSHDDEHFRKSLSLDGFIEEIHSSGISKAVVVGRATSSVLVPNERIHELTAIRRELIGIGAVDPQSEDIRAAADEAERAVTKLGLAGINIEPGFGNPPLACDDPTLFPIYETCLSLDVPVFLMSGPTAPRLDLVRPEAVAAVAVAFPRLSIVCYHGFYPYVSEMIGVAFRHENVFIVPDMYLFLPAGQLYVEAANGFMKEQLLFGTSYPFRAMRQTVEEFVALDWREDTRDHVLYRNADRLLNQRERNRKSK